MSWNTIDTKIAEGKVYLPYQTITFNFYSSGKVYAESDYGDLRVNTWWIGRAQALDHLVVYNDRLFEELFWEWED